MGSFSEKNILNSNSIWIAFSNCNSFRSEDLAPLGIPVTVYSSQTRGEVTVPAWRLVTGDNRLTLMRHFDLMSGHNSVGNTQVCGLFLRLRVPAPGMMLMLVLPHLLASDPMSFFRQTKGISAWCPADQPSRAGALFKKKKRWGGLWATA